MNGYPAVTGGDPKVLAGLRLGMYDRERAGQGMAERGMTAQELERLAKDGKLSEWLDQYISENRKFLEAVGRL